MNKKYNRHGVDKMPSEEAIHGKGDTNQSLTSEMSVTRRFITDLLVFWNTCCAYLYGASTGIGDAFSRRMHNDIEYNGRASPQTQWFLKNASEQTRHVWRQLWNPVRFLWKRKHKYVIPGWKSASSHLIKSFDSEPDTTLMDAAYTETYGIMDDWDNSSDAQIEFAATVMLHADLASTVIEIVAEETYQASTVPLQDPTNLVRLGFPHPNSHGCFEGAMFDEVEDGLDVQSGWTITGSWFIFAPMFWLFLSPAKRLKPLHWNPEVDVGSLRVRKSSDYLLSDERPLLWTDLKLITLTQSMFSFAIVPIKMGKYLAFKLKNGSWAALSGVTGRVSSIVWQFCYNKNFTSSNVKVRKMFTNLLNHINVIVCEISSDRPNTLPKGKSYRGSVKAGPKMFLQTTGEGAIQYRSESGQKGEDMKRVSGSWIVPIKYSSSWAWASWSKLWKLDERLTVNPNADVGEVELPADSVKKVFLVDEIRVYEQHVTAQLQLLLDITRATFAALRTFSRPSGVQNSAALVAARLKSAHPYFRDLQPWHLSDNIEFYHYGYGKVRPDGHQMFSWREGVLLDCTQILIDCVTNYRPIGIPVHAWTDLEKHCAKFRDQKSLGEGDRPIPMKNVRFANHEVELEAKEYMYKILE
jgi:hypothetical protein